MATPHILFQNAVVFDSETTSLTTKHGQGLVEATIHTLDTNETYEYIVKPNLIKVSINNAIDQISSAGTPVDVLSQYHPAIWLQVYEEQLRSKGMLPPGDVTPAQV
ncbi:MAG: hypothetical protein HYS80_00925, partial [Candidatus Aenigmarchaeota archaeon]|nr:hypothetical protein [Candidatus Aenigmarchaeota archaeon]